MHDLAHQRCINHKFREAVARCPECRRYFCRECVTEHEDRVLCAACLGGKIDAGAAGLSPIGLLTRIIHLLLGGMFLWIFFYYLGQVLLSLPSSFHEGTLWQMEWWKPQ